MARTYFETFERDDETEVTVEYTFSGGCPAHMGSMSYAGHPAEPAEVEIVKAFSESDDNVVLTDVEDQRFCQHLIENHEEPDDSDWERE